MMEAKKIFLTIKIFTLLMSLVVIYFIFEIQFIDAKLGYLELLNHNWNKGPIMSIIETEDPKKCPESYSHLIDDYWPGTIEGCLCKTIFTGNCKSQISSSKTCQDIPAINNFHYKLWKNKHLCALRIPTNYRDIYNKRTVCEEGEKSCGKLDSLNNILCVPSDFSCPINFIKILTLDEFEESSEFKDTNIYQSFNLTNQNVLVVSNQISSGNILVEFRISENSPCADPDYENNGKHELYVLDKFFRRDRCSSTIAGKQIDERYTFLDSSDYKDLVEESGLIKLLKKLPLFPLEKSIDHSVNLYTRGYIGYKLSCSSSWKKFGISMGDITHSIDYIESHYIKMKDYYWIWHLFMLFTVSAFICMLIFSIVQKVKKVVEKTLFTLFPISFTFLLIGSFNMRGFSNNLYGAYKLIVPETACGDDYTNDAVESFMLYLYDFSRIVLLLILLKLVLIILAMTLICRNSFKRNSLIMKSTTLPENYQELKKLDKEDPN